MALYEITLIAVKTFYVEADSQEDALNHDVTVEEQSSMGEIDWEFDEGRAQLLTEREEKYTRQRYPQEIF